MNSSSFKANQFKHLAAILNSSTTELEWVLNHVSFGYGQYSEEKKNKAGQTKRYKDGTPKARVIMPVKVRLKRIQKAIKSEILDKFPMPEHVQGSTKGKSNITNAKAHQGRKYVFTTDLQDFFPSVTHALVYHTFLVLGHSDLQSSWLTKLTTRYYGLPQGAPTSPGIANIAFLDVDNALLFLCQKLDIVKH